MKYDRHTFYFVEISRGGAMTSKIFALFALLAAPISALAQMSCTALGAHLATQPNISQYVPPLPAPQVPQPFTQVIGTRCEANFIYSSRGGPADGYAVAQAQRIGIRVGSPLNSFDNGGLPPARHWKVRNRGGGGLQGGLSAVTTADRKSTRLNSSHITISYAVFCL